VLVGPQVTVENAALMEPILASGKALSFHLLGDRRDIPAILPALDIYTSASVFGEGFSNSVGEAMSCGVPCVVTDVGDSAWVVGHTGLVIPPCDAQAMVMAWKNLLAVAPIERGLLGQAARQRVQTHFDIRQIALHYQNVYREFAQHC
jgi:glycosyltransferase involved in cell wall biosynthesis